MPPFTSYPAAHKALKTQQICQYRLARKTRGLFLLHDSNVDFSSCSKFANVGSFAKVSTPVRSIIPCWRWFIYGSYRSLLVLLWTVC